MGLVWHLKDVVHHTRQTTNLYNANNVFMDRLQNRTTKMQKITKKELTLSSIKRENGRELIVFVPQHQKELVVACWR